MRTQKYTAIIAILFIALAGFQSNAYSRAKRPCALTDAHWRAIKARFAAVAKEQAALKALFEKLKRQKGTIGGPSAKELTALRASLKALKEELAALTEQLKKTPRGAGISAKELAAFKAQLTMLSTGIDALTKATIKGDDSIVAELKVIQGQLVKIIAAIPSGTPGSSDRLPSMIPSKKGPLAGPHLAVLATGSLFGGGDDPGGLVGLVQLTVQGEYVWPVNVGLYGALHFGAALLEHEDLAMFAMSATGGLLFVADKYISILLDVKYTLAFNQEGDNPNWTVASIGVRFQWEKKFALIMKGGLTVQSWGIPAVNGPSATLAFGFYY